MNERLIVLLENFFKHNEDFDTKHLANYLIEKGVMLSPCEWETTLITTCEKQKEIILQKNKKIYELEKLINLGERKYKHEKDEFVRIVRKFLEIDEFE